MSTFQTAVSLWVTHCFGAKVADNTEERSFRFMEECFELAQSTGITKKQILEMVEYTYDRPKGVIYEEVGGVLVTLAALCQAHGLDMMGAGNTELHRIWTPDMVARVREKQATKPHGSPLPGKSE